MYEQTFRWMNRPIRLLYTIEKVWGERWLVIEDVTAATQAEVDAVPDWKIDLEAAFAADDHDAQYL